METTSPYRPRVSRETRLLLAAGVMAVAALWLLARFRFPERPVTPNPVPAVLSQLASGPTFDDLTGEIGQLQARLQPSLVGLGSRPGVRDSSPTRALRLRDDLAVTWIPLEPSREPSLDAPILARDAASGLAVVRVPASVPAPRPVAWTLRQPQQSRFLFASDASPQGVSLRPVFIGSIEPVASPLWPEPLWIVPTRTDLDAGAFLFASSGELAGLVIRHREGVAIVPGETVISAAERLLATPPAAAGAIGLDVQELTPALAEATGASVGVVVAWVDQQGAGRDQVRAGDVVEALDGRPLITRQLWDVRQARLRAGESIVLRVRRRGEVREVTLVATAAAATAASGSRPLGLTLRGRSRIGAEVIRVERESAADLAGLTAGDVITLVGDVVAPAPDQVVRSYTSSDQGARLIVAVTRGEVHFVTTLER